MNRVDAWYGSRYCAVVSWGGWVRLFSISDRAFVRDLFTYKDSGGVSVAISADDQLCLVGSYYAWALACFDIRTGDLVWKREDLRRFYGLTFSPELNSLFGYFDGKSALRIDPRTGRTLESFRGVKDVAASPFTGLVLFGDSKSFVLRNGAGERLWAVPRESFAVLDVAWSPDTVAISEVAATRSDGAKAGIRCYSLHGELLWRYKGRKTHVQPLMYNPQVGGYVGVDFTAGTEDRFLVYWEEQTGGIKHERVIPHTMHGEICQQGSMMFSMNYKTYEWSLQPIR